MQGHGSVEARGAHLDGQGSRRPGGVGAGGADDGEGGGGAAEEGLAGGVGGGRRGVNDDAVGQDIVAAHAQADADGHVGKGRGREKRVRGGVPDGDRSEDGG